MNKKILFKVNIDVKSAKISTTILFAFLKSMFPCTRPCGYLYSHVSLTFYDVFDIYTMVCDNCVDFLPCRSLAHLVIIPTLQIRV